MARRCLDAFKGRTVCHVGEWGGMTGDATFEKQLTESFQLVKVVPLPNWTNTCYALTVWQRRGSGTADPGAPPAVVCCSGCGGPVPLDGGVRSRLCHRLAYCSQTCVDSHADDRDAAMAAQLLPSVLHRRQHFTPLLAGSL
ncbi:uncharacterized protein LOC142356498 [Convolutriloba macropyga]|uniref:uncharacterized protein LOC142356498 n=1 Tax=Convolutriloba macropyga TaxID=536237 RepID=UPI003F5201FF